MGGGGGGRDRTSYFHWSSYYTDGNNNKKKEHIKNKNKKTLETRRSLPTTDLCQLCYSFCSGQHSHAMNFDTWVLLLFSVRMGGGGGGGPAEKADHTKGLGNLVHF